MLRMLGLRAYRRAGAVAPVGGRFALAAECLLTSGAGCVSPIAQVVRAWCLLNAGAGRVTQTAQVARSWGGPLGPTGSDCDPAAPAALAKRAERVPAHEAKEKMGAGLFGAGPPDDLGDRHPDRGMLHRLLAGRRCALGPNTHQKLICPLIRITVKVMHFPPQRRSPFQSDRARRRSCRQFVRVQSEEPLRSLAPDWKNNDESTS